MKKTLAICIFLLISFTLFSQENKQLKQSLRFGVNGVFWGAGDVTGKTIYGEYIFPINKYIVLSPRIITGNSNNFYSDISNANTEYEFYSERYSTASSWATALALKITPFPTAFNRFKFDIGIVHHQWTKMYGQQQIGFNSHTDIEYRKQNSVGLIGSLNLQIIDNNNFETGV